MRKPTLSTLLILSGIMLMWSCASVKFYTDESLKNETGLRVYTPKPFLLVEYRNTKTESVRTTIVYLPDLTKPQYIKPKPGIGANVLKVEITNGFLTAYGLTTDTKLPETLGKVTDLLTRSSTAISDLSANKTVLDSGGPVFELYEIVIADGQTKLVQVKLASEK
ncbi:MAG: hypothetical protein WC699_09455 [Bacteroidales bacterium]|jgi:hypothetical protein